MILEAILKEEKEKIKVFLEKFDLDYDYSCDRTLYVLENDEIVGTVSKERYIIKCLAVRKECQGTSVASNLVSEIISRIIYEGYTYYQVFTKAIYEDIFINLGFKKIVSTDNTCVLESSSNTINDYLKEEVKKIDFNSDDIASVVINANPITLGHLNLIETASKEHDHVLVFVLEEEKSMFTFKERFSLVFLATRHLNNVTVLKSSNYIISSLTFPSYFLKEKSLVNKEYALIDALIFKNYFMKYFNIKYRYVGKETSDVMKIYNETLKEILKDSLIEIDRKDDISASTVRKLIEEERFDESLKYIPDSIQQLYLQIALNK